MHRLGHALVVSLIFIVPARGEVTLEDIIEGLRDAEKAVKTVSVTGDFHADYYNVFADGLRTEVTMHGVCTFDSAGRCRFEGHGKSQTHTAKPSTQEIRKIGVFDGERFKLLTGNLNKYHSARVAKNGSVEWPLDPRGCLGAVLFPAQGEKGSVREWIVQKGGTVRGKVKYDGRDVVLIETQTHTDPTAGKTKLRIWIDLERGFALVRWSAAVFRPAANDWFDYVYREGYEYSEAAPGIWAPGRVVEVGYGQSPTILNPSKHSETHARFSNWIINGTLSDSLFDVEFPPAIQVTDEISGKTYQTVEVKNGVIVKQVAEGLEIYKDKKAGAGWNRVLIWGGGALLGFGILVLLFVVIRRRKARIPSPLIN